MSSQKQKVTKFQIQRKANTVAGVGCACYFGRLLSVDNRKRGTRKFDS